MATVSFYRDGVPYDTQGHPMAFITNVPSLSTSPTAGVGLDLVSINGVNYEFGMRLVTVPSSVSQHIDPLAFAKNVAKIHNSELTQAVMDTDAKQKTLDKALAEAQVATINAFNDGIKNLNNMPQIRAQTFVNYQNAMINELKAKIASESNAVDYIDQDIMLNNGRIWWPSSKEDAAAAQQYIDSRQPARSDAANALENDKNILNNVQASKPSPQDVTNEITSALQFVSDFFKEVTNKYGAKAQASANELAKAAVGKKIKNANDAIAAFNKYQGNINKKFSQKDREAIANAIASMDQANIAKNLASFSKAFSFISYSLSVADIVPTLVSGFKTGDFKPFFLKMETLVAGYYAAEGVAFIFAVITGSSLGIFGFGLLIALAGAMVDEQFVKKINDDIFG